MQFRDFEHRRDRLTNACQVTPAIEYAQEIPDVSQDWYVGLCHAHGGYEMNAADDLTGVKPQVRHAVYKAKMLDDGQQQRALGRRGHLPVPLAQVMSVLPLAPLTLAAGRILENALARNSSMLSRLGEHATKRFAIDPVDCPFGFILEANASEPRLVAVPSVAMHPWDARIAAPLLVLLGLVDGRYDGDALFFTRDLVIEGDTAAVLALRNAIEDSDLEPADALGAPKAVAPFITTSFRTLTAALRNALGAPAEVD